MRKNSGGNVMMLVLYGLNLIILLAGCRDEIQCTNSALIDIQYVGYTLPELDTVVLRRYEKPLSAGSKMKDSGIWIQPDHISYVLHGDTARVSSITKGNQPFFISLESAWDYEVYIPSTGTVYQVTNRVEQQTSQTVDVRPMSGPKYAPCSNPILEVRINGKKIVPEGRNLFYKIYLEK